MKLLVRGTEGSKPGKRLGSASASRKTKHTAEAARKNRAHLSGRSRRPYLLPLGNDLDDRIVVRNPAWVQATRSDKNI
jgi:hypothetical protein